MKEKLNQNQKIKKSAGLLFFNKEKILPPGLRKLGEHYSQIMSRRARVRLFQARLDGVENLDQVKKFYVKNAKAITFATALDGHTKEEALRRLEKDRQVAERFSRAGLLGELIEIEEEEIQFLLQDPLKFQIINPRVAELCKELERREKNNQ